MHFAYGSVGVDVVVILESVVMGAGLVVCRRVPAFR
jgi:hypothetical protein